MEHKLTGDQTINGAHGILYLNGLPVFEVEDFNSEVEMQRTEIQFGMDIDSKLLGLKGKGSFSVKYVYDRGFKGMLEAYKRGEDPRSTIDVVVADPGAPNKGRVSTSIANVWFDNLVIANFTKGEVLGKTYEFGFTPTTSEMTEVIS